MEDMKSGAAGLPRESEKNIEAFKARSRRLSIADASFWAVMWGFGESYVAPFAIALKAGNTAMAVLSTIPQLCGAFAQLSGASLTERLSTRRPIIVTCLILQGVCFFPLFVLPYLFPSISVPSVVLVYTLMVIFGNLAMPPWLGMVGDFVDEDTRGRYFARRSQYAQVVMIAAMLAASCVLSAFKHADRIWLGFGVLFATALAARCTSALLQSI